MADLEFVDKGKVTTLTIDDYGFPIFNLSTNAVKYAELDQLQTLLDDNIIKGNARIFHADRMTVLDVDATEMIVGWVPYGSETAAYAGEIIFRNSASNKNLNGLWVITSGNAVRYGKADSGNDLFHSYTIIEFGNFGGQTYECTNFVNNFGVDDIEFEQIYLPNQALSTIDSPIFNALNLALSPSGSISEGQLRWNSTDQALEVGTGFTGVATQLGQEMVVKAVNKTLSTIDNGSVVYIDGAVGNRPKMLKAKADAITTCQSTIAVTTHSIDNNNEGLCTSFGIVRGVNTSGMTAGDILYLSETTAGAFTNIRPTSAYFAIKIGYVLYAHLTQGEILVVIDKEYSKFGDITNGNFSEFEDDGTLKFNGNATVWEDENYDAFTAGGVADPNLTVVDGSGISLPAFPHNLTKSLQGGREVPHSYKDGSDVVLHVHLMPTTAPANGETVKFSVEYYFKKNNVKVAAAVAATTYTFQTGSLEAWREHRFNLATVTGTNIVYGMQAMIKITRTSGDAGTYANPVVVSTFGYHYEKDTVGSRTITSK